MPTIPLRPCRKPGCLELVPGGYCEAHTPKRTDSRSAEAKAWHRLYLLPIWTEDLRPTQLLKEPFCEECAKQGRRVWATDVDHRREHKGDMAIFVDRSNLRSMCHSCHSRKTAKDLWAARKKHR